MTTAELNAKFDQFLKDNNGKKIERVDPNAYAQCFDLAIYWCEYLGLPKTIFAGLYGANEIYNKWSHPQFEKLPNTPTFIPKKGDIGVWAASLNGGIGHVAICTGEGDTNHFRSFDQNWIVGSPSVVVDHNYGHFLGVQRLKVNNSTPPMNDTRTRYFEILRKGIWGDRAWESLTLPEVEKVANEYKSQRERSGKWDLIARKANFSGDTNQLTVEYLFSKIAGKYEELKKAVTEALAQA